jgi:homocysteine S-methyltransferase
MLTKDAFTSILNKRGTLVIDGALATELESRGHNLTHPLWSGLVLRDSPESIQQVHLDYYLAGADVAITASYQASSRGLAEHFGLDEDASSELIKRSVKLAQNARDEAYETGIKRQLLVAGSVGPFGAYINDGSEYRGDYERTSEEFRAFHRPRIQALVDAGSDFLAIETMPKLEEIIALLDLLRDEFANVICWLTCTLKDDQHLSDGNPLRDLVNVLNRHSERIVAFGINCVPIAIVSTSLQHMQTLTQLPLACYPNSGEIYEAGTNSWKGTGSQAYNLESLVHEWQSNGAKLIGGCCRTGPDIIPAIARATISP